MPTKKLWHQRVRTFWVRLTALLAALEMIVQPWDGRCARLTSSVCGQLCSRICGVLNTTTRPAVVTPPERSTPGSRLNMGFFLQMSTSGCVLLYPCLVFLASLVLYFEIGSLCNYIRLLPGALTECKWIDWLLRLTEVVIENRAIYEHNLDINVNIYIVLTINLGANRGCWEHVSHVLSLICWPVHRGLLWPFHHLCIGFSTGLCSAWLLNRSPRLLLMKWNILTGSELVKPQGGL